MLEGFTELVFGNTLSLAPETMRRNLRGVQDSPVTDIEGEERPAIPEAMRTDLEPGEAPEDFSVEMETGTGKTYVYLRSVAELHRKYGFRKFVIVVPSVAIREGVLSSLRLLKEHISELYDGLQYDSYVYDSGHLNRVRQFATASHLQIMVINIDAFAKDSTIMNKPAEALGFYKPIEYVRRCRPIVIMDEPQNMETDIRREAIASLWPLFKLRYSATHRDLKHLVYRLTPVDAYDLNLVKRISVVAVTKDEDFNDPYVEVVKIHATGAGVTATVLMDVAGKQGTKRVQKKISKDDDLYAVSGHRDVYQGWTVEDIHAGDVRLVEFGNGRKVPETRSSAQGRGRPVDAAPGADGHRGPLRQGAPAAARAASQDDPRRDEAAHALLHRSRGQLPPEGLQAAGVVRGGVRGRPLGCALRRTRPARRR